MQYFVLYFPGCEFAKATEFALQSSILLTTLGVVDKEFQVTYELMAASFNTGYQNVFHMTTGGNIGVAGYRIASLWVSGGSYLHICSDVKVRS